MDEAVKFIRPHTIRSYTATSTHTHTPFIALKEMMCVSFSFQPKNTKPKKKKTIFLRAHLWYLNSEIVNCEFQFFHCILKIRRFALAVCVRCVWCVVHRFGVQCNWWSCVSSGRLLKNALMSSTIRYRPDRQLLFLSFGIWRGTDRWMRFDVSFRCHFVASNRSLVCGGVDFVWRGFSYCTAHPIRHVSIYEYVSIATLRLY